MDKRTMVEKLIAVTLNAIEQDPAREWLRDMLGHGFQGFTAMTTVQLRQEMELRGLIDTTEAEDAQAFDDDDTSEDYDELMVAMAGMVRLPDIEVA